MCRVDRGRTLLLEQSYGRDDLGEAGGAEGDSSVGGTWSRRTRFARVSSKILRWHGPLVNRPSYLIDGRVDQFIYIYFLRRGLKCNLEKTRNVKRDRVQLRYGVKELREPKRRESGEHFAMRRQRAGGRSKWKRRKWKLTFATSLQKSYQFPARFNESL